MYFCFCRLQFNNQKIVEDSMVPSDSFQNIILAIGVGGGEKTIICSVSHCVQTFDSKDQ